MIRIVKASAGSGKTFSLTRQYIYLLFSKRDKFAYRHILAVTFTNKATEEMKTRILKELSILAQNPEKSDYYDDFVPSLFPDGEKMSKAAKEMLCNILHDYGAFSVSTIDSFFQQTLRAFSREIGQFASYQVELDNEALFAETVDNTLDALTEDDKTTLGWLTESAFEQVEQGGRYNVEDGLKDMMARIKSEEHRVKIEKYNLDEEKAYSKENLKLIKDECDRHIAAFENSVMEAAKEVRDTMDRLGLIPKNFYRSFINEACKYAELKRGEKIGLPNSTFVNRAPDHELWFSKSEVGKYHSVAYPALEAPLKKIWNLFNDDYRLYLTVWLIRKQVYGLGLTGELNHSYNELLREKNVLQIDDTNLILKDIIDGSNAPFVYEKTGVWYENFLLDEFQDTSVIQWDNILPLLCESESNNKENFIVGDVKQSIYRWRGSDWNLLAHGLQEEERLTNSRVETLDTNFRSLRKIVEFNNGFFKVAAEELDKKLGEEGFVTDLFADVEQKCAAEGKPQGGCVSISFCDKADELQKVLDVVNEARAAGAELGDIAVLVRNNSDGADIAEFLITHGVNVLTDDSLNVKSSLTVNRIVSLMSALDNISDTVGSYLADSLGMDIAMEYQSLAELCESLIRGLQDYDSQQGEQSFSSEIAYIQSFVDSVLDYASVHGNSLRGFLDHWKEINPKISSPQAGNSVRILTVHKAKGLAFPFVIFPFAEKVKLFKSDRHWCVPRDDEGLIPALRENAYDIYLGNDAPNTLFDEDYNEERRRQFVDNVNVLYVALTRASRGMHIICSDNVGKDRLSYTGGAWCDFSDFSQALYMFAVSGGAGLSTIPDERGMTFRMGTLPDFPHKSDTGGEKILSVGYPSWPDNGGGAQRMVLSREYSDFFTPAGSDSSEVSIDNPSSTSVPALPDSSVKDPVSPNNSAASSHSGRGTSARIRGTVLHDILSRMKYPEDLENAVGCAVTGGELGREDASAAIAELEGKLASAVERGWFSADAKVYNERELIDTDGKVYRPDRVEIRPDGSVLIIDYKFGGHRAEYLRQISHYADIWRRMGHSNVSALLWYVDNDEVVDQ